ncbi:MAG: glycosyltransferase [Bacteroidia bacterium]
MEPKHIYWFAYHNADEASVRYRAIYPLQRMQEKHNISFDFVYPSYHWANVRHFIRVYVSVLFFRKRQSVIVYQKLFNKGPYTQLLRFLLFVRPSCSFYDIDDAEYLRRPDETILYFAKRTTACLGGSTALVEYLLRLNSRAYLLGSPVMRHHWLGQQQTGALCLGWIGYYGAHRENLEQLLFPALKRLPFPVRLKLLGVQSQSELDALSKSFSPFPHIVIEAPLNLNWHNEASIYQHISSFDLGLAPLLDTPFNQAKSAFKLKQCLSCGIPVLASPVGENSRLLQDGINGYLCADEEAFYQKLVRFKKLTPEQNKQMQLNARASLAHFSLDHYCQQWLLAVENH